MVANTVRYWRQKLGLRQLELSSKTGVSTSIIVATERYSYIPSKNVRQRLSEGMGVPEETLWPSLVSNANVKVN